MTLADQIRAEIAKTKARMEQLKLSVKKGVKENAPVEPMLAELKQLNIRLKELSENLGRAIGSSD